MADRRDPEVMDGLEAIAPATTVVEYQGERLDIRPLTIGQIPEVVRRARPVIDSVLRLESLDTEDQGALVDLVMDMITEHGDGVFEAASVVTGLDVAVIRAGGPDEFLQLCVTVFEVNRDFFVRRLAPMLADLKARRASGVGKTPSTSSSAPATH